MEIVVFVCGAVVMILEMVGSRILAPYLGTSIVVWTSLIGIILGSLSLGYYWGGRIADEKPSYRVLSIILLLAAFFIAGITLSKSFILGFLQQHTGSIHVGSAFATFVLFAPPSILLGAVSPYAVRLKMSDIEKCGATVGSLYAISTVGSILGTFLAGFYLIGFFGSTNILIILAMVLIMTSLALNRMDKLAKYVGIGIMTILFIGANVYDRYLAGADFHDIDTHYNRVLIYKTVDPASSRPVRVMVTGPQGRQSAMFLDDEIELAGSYTKFYKLARYFKPSMSKVLMLGGGGYSFPKYAINRYPDIRMDVVEIDPGITALAARFFALRENPRLRIIHEDARTFLNTINEKYDVILGDIFNSHYSIPFHLSTLETVERYHKLLGEDGVVLMNTIGSIDGDTGRFLRAEVATFKTVFPHVLLFPTVAPNDGSRWQNIMLVALKSGEKPSLFTDNPELKELLGHLWIGPVAYDLPPLRDDFAPVERYITTLN